MHNAIHKEDREFLHESNYFQQNRQLKRSQEEKIRHYKSKVADESYLDHAIQKIATDLTHFLTK